MTRKEIPRTVYPGAGAPIEFQLFLKGAQAAIVVAPETVVMRLWEWLDEAGARLPALDLYGETLVTHEHCRLALASLQLVGGSVRAGGDQNTERALLDLLILTATSVELAISIIGN